MRASPHPPNQPRSARAERPVQVKPNGLDARINQLASQFGVTLKELASLLQLAESTLHRLRRQTLLSGPTAERVDLLQQVFQHGLRVYAGNEQALRDWLRYRRIEKQYPQPSLTNRTPFIIQPVNAHLLLKFIH